MRPSLERISVFLRLDSGISEAVGFGSGYAFPESPSGVLPFRKKDPGSGARRKARNCFEGSGRHLKNRGSSGAFLIFSFSLTIPFRMAKGAVL